MSVLLTTHIADVPAEAAASAAERAADRSLPARTGTVVRLPVPALAPARRRHPVAGAVMLDLAAELAGPPGTPDHERAWSEAFEIVTEPMHPAAASVASTRHGAPRPEQRVLAVEFRAPDGRRWNAIGGGATVAAAIAYARESCPDDATWVAVGWNDLYGE
jgi:hypothetical protein